MVPDGYYYALALVGVAALMGWLAGPVWALPACLLALFFFWFFRDPERAIPDSAGRGGVPSRWQSHRRFVDCHRWSSTNPDQYFSQRVRCTCESFTSGRRDTRRAISKGKYLNAMNPASAEHNEQNAVTVEGMGRLWFSSKLQDCWRVELYSIRKWRPGGARRAGGLDQIWFASRRLAGCHGQNGSQGRRPGEGRSQRAGLFGRRTGSRRRAGSADKSSRSTLMVSDVPEISRAARRRPPPAEAQQRPLHSAFAVYHCQHRLWLLCHSADHARHHSRRLAFRQRRQGHRICRAVRWLGRADCAHDRDQQRFWPGTGLAGRRYHLRRRACSAGVDLGIPATADESGRASTTNFCSSARLPAFCSLWRAPAVLPALTSPAILSPRTPAGQARNILLACRFRLAPE